MIFSSGCYCYGGRWRQTEVPTLLPFLFALLILVGHGLCQELGGEKPTISVPFFTEDPSLVQRQNVCDRYLKYERGEVALEDALQGLEIRVLMFPNSTLPVYLDDEESGGGLNKDYPGMMVILMDEIARRGNFTWRNSYGIADDASIYAAYMSGKDWSDLLNWSTLYYDMVLEWFFDNIERRNLGISFPFGFYDASAILVGIPEEPEQDNKINLWQWLQPFTLEVWICIVLTVVISGALYQILDYIPPKTRRRREAKKRMRDSIKRGQPINLHNTGNSGIMDFTNFTTGQGYYGDLGPRKSISQRWRRRKHQRDKVGEGVFLSTLLFTNNFQFNPRTPASRIFSASLALWSMILAANYMANLASFYVIENTPTIPIKDIEEAIAFGFPLCVWGGTAMEEFANRRYPKGNFIKLPTQEEMFQAIRDRDCVAGLATVQTFEQVRQQSWMNPDCKLQYIGRRLGRGSAGFAARFDAGTLCTSLVNDVLNVHLMAMFADGFTASAWKEEIRINSDQDCDAAQLLEDAASEKNDDPSTKSRTIIEMGGTFIIHLICSFIAIAVYIIGRLCEKNDPIIFDNGADPNDFHHHQSSGFVDEDDFHHHQSSGFVDPSDFHHHQSTGFVDPDDFPHHQISNDSYVNHGKEEEEEEEEEEIDLSDMANSAPEQRVNSFKVRSVATTATKEEEEEEEEIDLSDMADIPPHQLGSLRMKGVASSAISTSTAVTAIGTEDHHHQFKEWQDRMERKQQQLDESMKELKEMMAKVLASANSPSSSPNHVMDVPAATVSSRSRRTAPAAADMNDASTSDHPPQQLRRRMSSKSHSRSNVVTSAASTRDSKEHKRLRDNSDMGNSHHSEWQTAVDPKSGDTYYYHPKTRRSCWQLTPLNMEVENQTVTEGAQGEG